MPALGRHVPAEQRELVSLLVREVVAQGVGQGREPVVEVGVPEAEPVQLGDRAVELFTPGLKVEGDGVAVRTAVADGRVSDRALAELMPVHGLSQSGERTLLVVSPGPLHIGAQPSDLLVLMPQDIDNVGRGDDLENGHDDP